MARQRAIEGCVYTCLLLDSKEGTMQKMVKLGKQNEKKIQQARQENKKWKSEVPIHIAMFVLPVETILEKATSEEDEVPIQQFLQSIQIGIPQLCSELKYWRRMSGMMRKSTS